MEDITWKQIHADIDIILDGGKLDRGGARIIRLKWDFPDPDEEPLVGSPTERGSAGRGRPSL